MEKLTVYDAPEERMSKPNQPGYVAFSNYLTFAVGFTFACGFGFVGGSTATLCLCCFMLFVATYVIRDVWVREIHVNFEKWKAEERAKEKDAKAIKIQPKKSEIKHDFTSDDFDDAAKAFLVSQVKQAKRAKTKVSGAELVQSFLRSVR